MAARPRAARAGSFAAALERGWLSRGAPGIALLPLAWIFGVFTALRRALYRAGLLRSVRLPVPVVVVGNLIVGGAGKTPAVLAVVALLERRGFRPGIVSRGYGRRTSDVTEVDGGSLATDVGDEPLMLRRRARVPVVVGADRVAAAQALLRSHRQVDVIVSDDGLQHLKLHRDAAVLVFDERGIGNGWRLPAGPLREAFGRAPPPRSVVLYNADRASTPWPGHHGVRRLQPPVPLAAWARGSIPAIDWTAWTGRLVVAAAGVARPERFFSMLRAHGLDIDACPLPDHFDFATLPWPIDGVDVIVTEKDAVKLDPARAGNERVWVAALDFAPDDAFAAALLELIEPAATPTLGKQHGTAPL